jgi:Protein of unknown function (DUF433)
VYSRTSHLGLPHSGLLASGWTVHDVLERYPGLEEADVLACIAYGAEMARERYLEIPLETQA